MHCMKQQAYHIIQNETDATIEVYYTEEPFKNCNSYDIVLHGSMASQVFSEIFAELKMG